MEKEIDINGRKIVIKEITYLDSVEVGELKQKVGLKLAIKKQLLLSTNLTEEEITKLTLQEGATIQIVINEINAIDLLNFQKPIEEKENRHPFYLFRYAPLPQAHLKHLGG